MTPSLEAFGDVSPMPSADASPSAPNDVSADGMDGASSGAPEMEGP